MIYLSACASCSVENEGATIIFGTNFATRLSKVFVLCLNHLTRLQATLFLRMQWNKLTSDCQFHHDIL